MENQMPLVPSQGNKGLTTLFIVAICYRSPDHSWPLLIGSVVKSNSLICVQEIAAPGSEGEQGVLLGLWLKIHSCVGDSTTKCIAV